MRDSERRVQRLSNVEVVWQSPRSHHAFAVIACEALQLRSPILEPDLHLSGAEAWDLPRKSLTMSCIGMRLTGKLAHQKAGLIMCETEPLHLALLSPDLGSCHRWLFLFLWWLFSRTVLVVFKYYVVVLAFVLLSIIVFMG